MSDREPNIFGTPIGPLERIGNTVKIVGETVLDAIFNPDRAVENALDAAVVAPQKEDAKIFDLIERIEVRDLQQQNESGVQRPPSNPM